MTTTPPVDTATVEAFARSLDILSDRSSMSTAGPGDSDLLATAVALQDLDTQAVPRTNFASALERRLTTTAATVSPSPLGPIGAVRPANPARPTARRFRTDRSWWRSVVEVGGLAAMLAAIVGSVLYASGVGLLGRSASQPAPTLGMDRGNASRTGAYADPGPGDRVAPRWQVDTNLAFGTERSLSYLPPVVAGDAVYAVSGFNGELFRFHPDDGWTAASAHYGPVDGTNIAVAGDLVYLATAGPAVSEGGDLGYLIAIDALTLSERWRVPTGGVIRSPIAIEGGRVFVVAVGGVLLGFDATTGEELLRMTLALGFGPVGNAVADGTVYVSSDASTLQAVDATDGMVRWSYDAPGRLGTPVVSGDGVYVIARDGGGGGRPGEGAVVRLDRETGVVAWQHPLVAWTSQAFATTGLEAALTPTVDGRQLYLVGDGASGKDITALGLRDGAVAWSVVERRSGRSAPIVVGDRLILALDDGRIVSLAVDDGAERWSIDTANLYVLPPVVVGSTLLALTGDGTMFAFGPASADASPTTSLDVSGLPPCDAPRRRPDPLPTGQPSPRFAPIYDEAVGTWDSILLSSIPKASEPSDAAVAGIMRTLETLRRCFRPGYEQEFGGLFSDDYYRQLAVRARSHELGNEVGAGLPADLSVLPHATTITRLTDGRTGWLIMPEEEGATGLFLIFTEDDGWWVIDEIWHVQREPGLLCC